MELYQRIKERRKLLKISQEDLAQRLGYKSRSAIAKIEAGVNDIPQAKIAEFAKALDTTVGQLMGIQNNAVTLSEGAIANDMLEIALQTDEGKEHLKRLIEKNLLVPLAPENKKIPIIGSVKCGPNGLAFEYLEGYVCVGDNYNGDIIAFHCRGDSMKDVGIADGDIAIVRLQAEVESGEFAVVTINGDEGTLKRIRKFEGGIMLEAANPAYPPRIFTGKDTELIHIVGKVLEIRRTL